MCKLKANKQKWIYLWYLFSRRIQQGLPHTARLFIQDHWVSIWLFFFSLIVWLTATYHSQRFWDMWSITLILWRENRIFLNVDKYIHTQERLCGAQLLLSNRPFWTLMSYQHMQNYKVKGFSRTKSTHCAMALHFIFLQCQVSGQANGFPLYIQANSSVLHLDLSEIHQKCDLITSPPLLPLPKRM